MEKLERRKLPHEIRQHIAGIFKREVQNNVPTTKVFTMDKRLKIYGLLDMASREDKPREAALAMEKATNLIQNLIPRDRYNEIVNEGRRLSKDSTGQELE